MTKANVPSFSIPRRLSDATALVLLATHAFGCVAEPGEVVGEAQQALINWNQSSHSSTQDLTGFSLPSTWQECILSGVQGKLNAGQSQGFALDLMSEVNATFPKLMAHGGGYDSNDPQPGCPSPPCRDFADNLVGAKATCFDNQVTGEIEGTWIEDGLPVKVADLATGRQCWLRRISTGDGTFNSSSEFVEVKKVTTAIGNYTSPGWWIDGNLTTFGSSKASARAVCYTMPTGYEAGTYEADGETTTTFANYLSACGLTRVQGAFTTSSTSSGTFLEIDSGTWKLHATSGKSAKAVCVGW